MRHDTRGDHFSRPVVTEGLKQPTRPPRRTGDARGSCLPGAESCLVLHAAGLAMPAKSPSQRCALTAPFHPYPPPEVSYGSLPCGGGLFSVALSRAASSPKQQVGVTHRRVLPCSDFPPVSRETDERSPRSRQAHSIARIASARHARGQAAARRPKSQTPALILAVSWSFIFHPTWVRSKP